MAASAREGDGTPVSKDLVGKSVEAHGLVGRADLNGRCGTVREYHEDRCAVQFGEEHVLIKPANLRLRAAVPPNCDEELVALVHKLKLDRPQSTAKELHAELAMVGFRPGLSLSEVKKAASKAAKRFMSELLAATPSPAAATSHRTGYVPFDAGSVVTHLDGRKLKVVKCRDGIVSVVAHGTDGRGPRHKSELRQEDLVLIDTPRNTCPSGYELICTSPAVGALDECDMLAEALGQRAAPPMLAGRRLGMTEEQYESSWKPPEPAAIDTYGEKLREALGMGDQVTEAVEAQLAEYRLANGITSKVHASAIEDLGLNTEEYEAQRRGQLRGALEVLARSNASRNAELAELGEALGAAQAKLYTMLGTEASAEAAALRKQLDESETALASLRAEFEARRTRLETVTSLLDGREAELYEMEEAVREYEARVQVRSKELGAIDEQLRYTEEAMRTRMREFVRLEAMSDAERPEPPKAGGRWQNPSKTALPFPADPNNAANVAADAAADSGVDEAALRESARVRNQGKTEDEIAGFHTFHAIAMSIKLTLCSQPFLRNLRIDELWELARAQSVPQESWNPWIRAQLVAPIPARASERSSTDALLDTVQAIGTEVRTAFAKVGREVEGALRDVEARFTGGGEGAVPLLTGPAPNL